MLLTAPDLREPTRSCWSPPRSNTSRPRTARTHSNPTSWRRTPQRTRTAPPRPPRAGSTLQRQHTRSHRTAAKRGAERWLSNRTWQSQPALQTVEIESGRTRSAWMKFEAKPLAFFTEIETTGENARQNKSLTQKSQPANHAELAEYQG